MKLGLHFADSAWRAASPDSSSGGARPGGPLPAAVVTRHDTEPSSRRRAWAWAGVAAGIGGIVTFVVAPTIGAYPDSVLADNALIAAEVDDSSAIVWVFQVVTTLTAALLVIFGTGLHRRLAEQEPVGSLLPSVAFAGTLLTAGMSLVGGGISTELFWALTQDLGATDPDTVGAALTIFNTMAWVWAALGLSAGAAAIAALRHGSVPRWIGWVSVVSAAIIALTQVVPLQYLALVPGSLWLLIVGVGFARGERAG